MIFHWRSPSQIVDALDKEFEAMQRWISLRARGRPWRLVLTQTFNNARNP